MILAPATGAFAEAKETVRGKLIFDKMVGLVDGILKFISSFLLIRFWEWMGNAIKFETGSVFIRWFVWVRLFGVLA